MKIIINEQESYSLELPNEIKLTEFQGLLTRLNRLDKIFGKDVISLGLKRTHTRNDVSDDEVLKLYKEGKNLRQIGELVGKSQATIWARVDKLKREGKIK